MGNKLAAIEAKLEATEAGQELDDAAVENSACSAELADGPGCKDTSLDDDPQALGQRKSISELLHKGAASGAQAQVDPASVQEFDDVMTWGAGGL